jgi:deoxyhypusine synthase
VRNKVEEVALKHGMISLPDTSGTNIDVQIFDTAKINWAKSSFPQAKIEKRTSAYCYGLCFGEQAYETIDELLKPFKKDILLNVESVSIMGKRNF